MEDEAVIEFAAQIAALRFLLEQAYANSFLGNEEGFRQFMAQMRDRRGPSSVLQAQDAEIEMEVKARINVHLERFEQSTAKRIQQGRAGA